MIRLLGLALGLGLLISGSARAQPKPPTDEQVKRWAAKVGELKPDEQKAAFLAKMGELNSKLDTNGIKIVSDKDSVAREVRIPTEYAVDIRPVAVFRDLEKLNMHAAPGTLSKVDNIRCLSGLTKLKELSLGSTSVADLAPLAALPLEKLYLANTPVKDIRALKKMPLTDVELPPGVAADQLVVLKDKPLRTFATHGPGPDTAKQVTDIFGKANLETYRVAKSNLDDLKPLANMPLRWLALGDAPRLKSLAPLANCNALQLVSFSKAPLVTDLTAFAGKPLTQLEVPHCPGVRDLAPVKQMPNLYLLSLYGTGVDDLTPVAGLNKLEKLWINNIKVKSLKPLANLPKLAHLDVHNTAVADKDFTPITKLPALKTLWIDVDQTTDPLVRKIPTLEMLNGKPWANPK